MAKKRNKKKSTRRKNAPRNNAPKKDSAQQELVFDEEGKVLPEEEEHAPEVIETAEAENVEASEAETSETADTAAETAETSETVTDTEESAETAGTSSEDAIETEAPAEADADAGDVKVPSEKSEEDSAGTEESAEEPEEVLTEEPEAPAEKPEEVLTEEPETPSEEPAVEIEEPTEEIDEPTEEIEEPTEAMETVEPDGTPTAASTWKVSPTKLCGFIFIVLLVLVFILNIIAKDKLYSDQENRVFQQLPEFSVSNYLSGRFESQLDNYAEDQFIFRNGFIKIKSAADLSMGQLKANNVFKCKDAYLMEDITYPSNEETKADIEALKSFKKKYNGKKMYFMLVPNAANILKSKLPGGVVTRDQNKDMDAFFKEIEAIGYTPIDVRDDLKKASRTKQIYYRTDHHWTTDGAFVAYKKAFDVMGLKTKIKYKSYTVKNDFAGTLYSKSGFTNGRNDAIRIYLPDDKKALNSVIRYTDTKEKTTNYYDMENLDKKDAYTVFGGTNHSLFSISTPTKTNKHLLVIKDSYANCFIPFLTQNYRTITVVDPRYYYENIETVIKAEDIDEVLFLYNANTFFSDNYMKMMLTNE